MKKSSPATAKKGSTRDRRRLAKLVVSQQKAERKVERLRSRLARAEMKLSKQASRLTAERSAQDQAVATPSLSASAAMEPKAPAEIPYEGEREPPPSPAPAKQAPTARRRQAVTSLPPGAARVKRNAHGKPSPAASPDRGNGGEA